jgi:hypothetical protein
MSSSAAASTRYFDSFAYKGRLGIGDHRAARWWAINQVGRKVGDVVSDFSFETAHTTVQILTTISMPNHPEVVTHECLFELLNPEPKADTLTVPNA